MLGISANRDIDMLYELATIYAGKHNLALTTVSLRSSGRGGYLAELTSGKRSTTLRRRDRMMRWFADNWPDDLPWPNDIPRPEPSKSAGA